MFKDKASGVKLPPVDQLGIVVRDIDKAVEYYEATFGWGPFSISEVSLEGCHYRGKPTDVRLKMAMAQSGPIEIELIQVLEGESIHSEFLREKGEGLQHVRFTVDKLDDILAEWAKAGIEPVWQHSFPEIGISWAYVNTDAIGGVMAELIEIKQV
jgi:4-hydroxyphenylpyruvate dioxygenase-like putative hemolysin